MYSVESLLPMMESLPTMAFFICSAVYSEFVSVDVADGATLNLVLTQQWDDDAIHVGEVVARLGKDANLRGTVVTLGGKVVRLNTSVAFAGEGAADPGTGAC